MKKILCALALAGIASIQSLAQHVSTGLYHSFAICDDGIVRCFGRNDNGQLGIGNTDNQNTPIPNSYMNDLVQADAGGYFSMFRNEAGNVWFSGSNAYGNFGNGTTSGVNTLPYLSNLSGIVDIAAGFGHAVVADNAGNVYAAGWGSQGQIGHGSFNNSTSFVSMNLADVFDVEAGYLHSLMLKSDGTVWACGSNNLGQIGMPNSTPYSNTPIQIPGLSNIVQISAGSYYSLFLDANGVVFATGSNPNGQLGIGNNLNQFGVVQLATGLPPISEVIAGNEHSFFRTASGDVYGVGLANFGQNGVGTTTNIPTQLNNPQNVIAVAAGGDGNFGQSLFLTSSGAMWGCGANGTGALGTSGPSFSTPTFITALCGSFLPQAFFDSNVTEVCSFPDPCIDFQNLSINASSVTWNFGHPALPESNSETTTFACYPEPGTYTVILTAVNEFGSSTHSLDVVVHAYPEVTISIPQDIVCINDGPLELTGGLPSGGVYSGTGITNGIFDPQLAGVGIHEVNYYVQTGPGCDAAIVDQIEVSECNQPFAEFQLSATQVCILEPCINVLDIFYDADSLVWDLPGTNTPVVINSLLTEICFDTPGNHLIKISAYNAYDSAFYEMNVTVYGLPEVTLDLSVDEACSGETTPISLSGGQPMGGVYSGPFVDAGQFDASVAEPFEYEIIYTYSLWEQCQASATQIFTVLICGNVDDINSSHDFIVIPNPDGSYNIQLSDNELLGSELCIFNSLGQLLHHSTLNKPATRIDQLPGSTSLGIFQLRTANGVLVKKVAR